MSGVSLKFNAQDALSKLWDAREELTRPAPLLNKMGGTPARVSQAALPRAKVA